ncbi:hypothetical protein ACP70R_034430 [Stipagrostis hirtigluma subsp. patula]
MPGQPKKMEWPECLNMRLQVALRVIKADRPDLNVLPLDSDHHVEDAPRNLTRVMVFYDHTYRVVEVPRVG